MAPIIAQGSDWRRVTTQLHAWYMSLLLDRTVWQAIRTWQGLRQQSKSFRKLGHWPQNSLPLQCMKDRVHWESDWKKPHMYSLSLLTPPCTSLPHCLIAQQQYAQYLCHNLSLSMHSTDVFWVLVWKVLHREMGK